LGGSRPANSYADTISNRVNAPAVRDHVVKTHVLSDRSWDEIPTFTVRTTAGSFHAWPVSIRVTLAPPAACRDVWIRIPTYDFPKARRSLHTMDSYVTNVRQGRAPRAAPDVCISLFVTRAFTHRYAPYVLFLHGATDVPHPGVASMEVLVPSTA
jgi:hypothetical protein